MDTELDTRFDVFLWSSEHGAESAQRMHSALSADGASMQPLKVFLDSASRRDSKLREHALGHAHTVVLLFSGRDLGCVERLSVSADGGQDITREPGFPAFEDFIAILELLRRRTVQRLIPVLDGTSHSRDVRALDMSPDVLRRIVDLPLKVSIARAKCLLGRVSGDSEMSLWDSELTMRGAVSPLAGPFASCEC